jgi:hypothetical protein
MEIPLPNLSAADLLSGCGRGRVRDPKDTSMPRAGRRQMRDEVASIFLRNRKAGSVFVTTRHSGGRVMALWGINDPEHLRARAAEIRVLAEGYTDKEAAQTLVRIADDYDNVAARLEARARVPMEMRRRA